MNETSAIEWLNKAYHHKSSAELLYKAKHFTDVIAIDLHYAIEVMLKSILAYQNKKIIKTHDLVESSIVLKDIINFEEEEIRFLALISTYHIRGSYPPKDRKLPSENEIKKVLNFANELFDKVCKILNIEIKRVEY